MAATQEELIRGLQDPSAFDHPVERFEVVETHISWVMLTGSYAYKIKKTVDFGFVDFSTLERRCFFCNEELRLNRRLAPELYLDVVSLNGDVRRPVVNGPGRVLDYAVKMRQFPRTAELDFVLERGELTAEQVEDLGRQVAEFHETIPADSKQSPFGEASVVHGNTMANFSEISERLTDPQEIADLEKLQGWSEARHTRHLADFSERKANGFVRECHGDMHLANMVLLDGRIAIFDGIDFNEKLRWIDVMSEVAFLIMDLESRSRSDLAFRFLNTYLEQTGDYKGVRLLHYYLVYRALVRAKVAVIRALQEPEQLSDRRRLEERCAHLVQLATSYTREHKPLLAITHGLSGSGKSTFSAKLVDAGKAIRVSSDVERKRLHGLKPLEQSLSGVRSGIYSAEATEKTYGRLAELSENILQAGFTTLVDATFLRYEHRLRFAKLAEELGVPFRILRFEASQQELRRRLVERSRLGADASEADRKVLEQQLSRREPIKKCELPFVREIDTTAAPAFVETWAALGDT